MSKDESRRMVYGMPYDEWRKNARKKPRPEQKAAFEKSCPETLAHREKGVRGSALAKPASLGEGTADQTKPKINTARHVNSVDDGALSLT